jgi:hypothetical protein
MPQSRRQPRQMGQHPIGREVARLDRGPRTRRYPHTRQRPVGKRERLQRRRCGDRPARSDLRQQVVPRGPRQRRRQIRFGELCIRDRRRARRARVPRRAQHDQPEPRPIPPQHLRHHPPTGTSHRHLSARPDRHPRAAMNRPPGAQNALGRRRRAQHEPIGTHLQPTSLGRRGLAQRLVKPPANVTGEPREQLRPRLPNTRRHRTQSERREISGGDHDRR